MSYLRAGAVALGTIVGTMLLGWWSVAVVGLASALASRPGRTAVIEAGGGAALGWAAILAGSSLSGPVWAVAQRVGPVFGVPALGFVIIALVFPALLAGSAALVAGALSPAPSVLARRTP